ncbi:hypothetical protein ACFW95_46445, partial [Streptomyces sp. NPDC059474]
PHPPRRTDRRNALTQRSALGRGFITGTAKPAGQHEATDMRTVDPRWQPGNFEENVEAVDRLAELAAATYIRHDAAGDSVTAPLFHGKDALAGWKNVVAEVYHAGGRILAQICHVGVQRPEGAGPFPDTRRSARRVSGWTAPRPVRPCPRTTWTR